MEFQGLLPSAPLLYVLGSVGFPPVLSMEAHIAKLQELLRHDYPLLEVTPIQHMTFRFDNEVASTVTTTMNVWHFLTIDRSWGITVENSKIILHTRSYTRFKVFADRISKVLATLKKVFELDYYTSKGVRYIDLVQPHGEDTLSDYLPDSMLIRQINGIAGQQIDGFSGAAFKTEYGNLAVRCWLNPAQVFPPDLAPLFSILKFSTERPICEFALLDTDHSSTREEPSVFDVQQIVAELDAMHLVCHKAFEGIPSDNAFRVWKK